MQVIKGVTPEIDSCAGLISQQAYKAYRRLSPEHKRWVDPEDLLQQALLEAVKAQKEPGRFDAAKGSKYSTYLYKALHFGLSKEYTDRLRVEKRRSGGIVELDAPVSGEDARRPEVPDRGVNIDTRYERARRAVNGFTELCRGCSPHVRLTLVGTLLCGQRVSAEDLIKAHCEAFPIAAKLGLRWEDLNVLRENEKIRKDSLIQLVRSGTIGLVDTDARVLECLECSGLFPLSAIREGTYYVSSMTCRGCYKALRKSSKTCFGKRKTWEREGYSESDVDCRLHCMDREACKQIQTKRGESKMVAEEVDELDDVEFDEPEAAPKKKTGKPAKAAVKPAKAKKSAKADLPPMRGEEAAWWTKYDEEEPPEGVAKWPFKIGSAMQRLFIRLTHGVSRKEFDEMLGKQGIPVSSWLKNVFRPQKHESRGEVDFTWKLDEEAGRLKITNVKFLGKKAVAKAEKPAKAKKVEVKAKVTKAVAKKGKAQKKAA